MRLDDREWKAIPIVSIFDRFEPGKGKGLNHLEQVEHGISYIGATNRNNGVLCFIRNDAAVNKMKQAGNCIGFIKNGDGSAGFAIYKQEPFVSTSDVIYGYAKWLNKYTGLFFVAAQDMIEHKYSHGYKRNAQHLKGDRVMLPVTEDGVPDYQFMEDYVRELMDRKRKQYLDYLGSTPPIYDITSDNEGVHDLLKGCEWKAYKLSSLGKVLSGRDIYAVERIDGDTPYITSGSQNNGIGYFVANKNDTYDKGYIAFNRNGAVGLAFYHPYLSVMGNDCRKIHLEKADGNRYVGIFVAMSISMQSKSFSYSRKLGTGRANSLQIMLPAASDGSPDYELMEQVGKRLMYQKYRQYLKYLENDLLSKAQ